MDSMLDLEQLRHSVNEQDIPAAIGQVQQWIDSHGLDLLGANQRLPFNYQEAEAIRKEHEKIELKCMTFLAFYAKINLKNIPENYQEMREDMDVNIHRFSDHIKARRHVVVSFYTLFRHYEKLQEKLAEMSDEDLSNLPDTIEEINALIGDFNKNIKHCLKRLSHLKVEGDRVKTSLNDVVTLNNTPSFEYVDRARIEEAKEYIDTLLRETEEDVTKSFETQRILELELKIEAKMMQIEEDISRCCGWLHKMEEKLVERYNKTVVGMATVETDVLHEVADELVNKMKATKEYGERLMQMYEQLCNQFKRDTSRGQESKEKFDEYWQLGELVSTECLNRLSRARKLFHGLDSTLNKVEDMLLSINKDKEANVTKEEILDKYNGVRNEAHGELKNLKQSASELFSKLRYDLFNKKIKSHNLQADQTEDMVRMKIFTIAVKLKELDRCILPDDILEVSPRNPDPIDDDLLGNIDHYIKFLGTTSLKWDSKPLPVTLTQADKALKDHHDISNKSEQYWREIQTALGSKGFQSKSDNSNQQRLLSEASLERKKWDGKWTMHLEEKLDPRYQFLKRLADFNDDLDKDHDTLEELMNRPNHNFSLVQDVLKDLSQLNDQIPRREQMTKRLFQEGRNIHKTDFNDALAAVEDKLNKHKDRLYNFIELEQMIVEILEFLPGLSQFKKEWQNKVGKPRTSAAEMRSLKIKADEMIADIGHFHLDKLSNLATLCYGNKKRVQWHIDELQAEFLAPEEAIVPLMAAVDLVDGPMKEFSMERPMKEFSVDAVLNSPTELKFEMMSLPRQISDQYNIQWYKDNVAIDPSKDPRVSTVCEPRTGKLSMRIERCEYGDAGKYRCEVHDTRNGVFNSYPINLTVSPSSELGTVDPLFDTKVFAGRNDPLTLELKLHGYRFAPDTELVHNNTIIGVNQRDCPWTRVSSNANIEFSHPAISNADSGLYEFVVDDNVVAKTEIVVGEAPKLFQHNYKETVKVGEQVSVTIPTAKIANKDNQKVIWRKDDPQQTSGQGNFSCRINRSLDPVFEIAQVRQTHQGVYTCEVFNEYGRTSAQLVLEVQPEGKEPSPKGSFANSTGSTVEELLTNVGESVTLAIDFGPAKQSEISWTKEGKPLSVTDPRIKITTENNSRCVLHINCARVTDSGLYTATVKGTNRKHSVNLEVIPAAPGPLIESYPQSVRVKVNEPLSIECTVKSVPTCDDIKWIFHPLDGGMTKNIINGPRHKVARANVGAASDNLQQLNVYIDRASRGDAGEYVVRCENSVGWTEVKIPVTVIDDAQNKRKPPTFVQTLKKEMISRSDEPVSLKCKVSGNPFPTVKWTKNSRDVVLSDFIKVKASGEVHELNILNPRASDAGTYEVIASNSEGSERCLCQLKVVDPTTEEPMIQRLVANNQRAPDVIDGVGDQSPQRTQLIFSNTVVRSPPQFVTTFTDEIVQEGDDVALKCCLIGQPEPVVWWSYNTHLLKNPRFEMTRQLDEYSLLMHDVKEEDSGRYSMTAENSSGLATCSALVIVDRNSNKGRYSCSMIIPKKLEIELDLRTLDRSQYKTSSRPMNAEGRSSPFQCHTTLSHAMNPSLTDESRLMQVSPRGWDDTKVATNSPRHHNK